MCETCEEGYSLIGGHCKACNTQCKTCDETNPNKCLSCIGNTLLKDNQCVKCNSNCLMCESSDALDKCISCRPGSYL